MNFLLIGRPNAGKSSLYNILTSGKNNIIHKEEGTTRDWHKSSVKNLENIFIYDTPGVIIENDKIDNLGGSIEYLNFTLNTTLIRYGLLENLELRFNWANNRNEETQNRLIQGGDIEFGNNLRTENGADIDGYIKKTNSAKSKLTGDFLFKKKDKKETSDKDDRPEVVNKEALA